MYSFFTSISSEGALPLGSDPRSVIDVHLKHTVYSQCLFVQLNRPRDLLFISFIQLYISHLLFFVWFCVLQSTPLDLIETGKGLKFQAERPHLVSLGSGRLSTAITLLPLAEGEHVSCCCYCWCKKNACVSERTADVCAALHTHTHVNFGKPKYFWWPLILLLSLSVTLYAPVFCLQNPRPIIVLVFNPNILNCTHCVGHEQ